jgi:group I intron endonuclease
VFYTYLHLRESDGKPFYIGQGSISRKRAYSHLGRNQHWHNTVAKHGLKVEIIAEWKTHNEVIEHEKFLIACFRDMGFPLVNMTDGGEGVNGYKHDEKTKEKISIGCKGKPGPWLGKKRPEHLVKNHAEILRGRPSPLRGRKQSKEHIEKAAATRIGKASGAKDRRWANNGLISKTFPKDTPLPEGFVLGRLKKAKNGA